MTLLIRRLDGSSRKCSLCGEAPRALVETRLGAICQECTRQAMRALKEHRKDIAAHDREKKPIARGRA